MKILVVEDDELNAYALTAVLTNQNYAVEVATDGNAAWNLIEAYNYDLILLDVMLPKLDGISLCRQIRSMGLQMPILLLTGCDSSHEKAIGLDAGADDYVVKPFEEEELVARVRALLRRGGTTSQPVLEWGDLRLDPSSCEVTYAQKLLSLTPKEYALLELFLRNSRRVFSCGMILEHLWSYEDTPGEEAVRTHIKGLRQKLKSVGVPSDLIETVYGIGYRLKLQEEERVQAKSKTKSRLPELPKQEQTLAAVAEIWQRFSGRVDEQVQVLEKAATALIQKTLNAELQLQAAQEAHTLAGSLGTFGLAGGSKLARKIEKLLKSEQNLTPSQTTNLQNLVKQLRQEIEAKKAETESSASTINELSLVAQPPLQVQHVEAKILAVDDDPQILALLQTLLSPWGLQVITLNDPQKLWETLADVVPDLLILDVEMPHSNGIELCQVVRNNSRWSDLPILFLTVHSDAEIVNQVFSVGADDFVSKPIVGPELVTRIVNRLERIKLRQRVSQTYSENRWRAIFDAEPECIKIIAADGTLLEINPAGLVMLEADNSAALIGKSVYPLIAPEYREAFRALNERVCQGHKGTLEFEIVSCLGNRRWVKTHAVPLRQEANGKVMQLAITQDITPYKEVETEIYRVNRTLQALSNCHQALFRARNEFDLLQQICQIIVEIGGYRLAWVGFAENDADKNIRPVAQAGYEAGYLQLLNLTWSDTIHGQSPTGIAIRTGQTSIIQNILIDPNYQLWQCQASKRGYAAAIAIPLITNGQVVGALNIYAAEPNAFDTNEVQLLQELAADLAYGILALRNQRDRLLAETALQQVKNELELRVVERTAELITVNQQLKLQLDERQRIQEALRISQTRLARILDIADDAIISIDAAQRITLFNQGAEKIFGYSAQEVMGQRLDILLPLRFSHIHRQHVVEFGQSSSLARKMGERREIYGCRKDGSEFPAEASVSKLDMGKEIVYTVILRDVTEQKQIERMKDEFVSVVSHELRTPLTSIHGSLGMLASGLLPTDSEQGKRLLQIATDSTERLVRLINDILDIERIESGKAKMEPESCNITDLITQAVNVMQPLADKAGVTLSISSRPFQLRADPDRIVQTLTNLLSNAIKFSPLGSTVWLVAQQQEDEILLAVKDTGRGIPTDKLESIFERFQQVDSSDSRNHDGTGLGLAICKSIVQQHNGRIWAESILGEGSNFYFTLPLLSTPQSSESSAIIHELEDISTQHLPLVLVCDDDATIRSELQTLLERGKYQVITVATGEEAIAQAAAQHPDVILLDLLMPGMNGWETMAVLKEREDTKDIPIVICSVYQPRRDNQANADFVDWLSKPVEESNLFESLRQLVANPLKQFKILIVEDDTNLAQLLITLFEKHEIETFLAKTGKEAIRLSQEINPDLLILDLILPVSDGFTVVDWLQQHHHLCNIPVVVYSAKDLNESERNRLKLGHTEFLTKGQITIPEFEYRVMELLRRITHNRREDRVNDNKAGSSG
ncbi:response regulator [Nostocaceae cyanobacterium CENA357]|uniref:histidine kinase n=1 Tax=Atlanticothrix silvestris CENA357 TaxID=1725252 RepID=A0A8J7HJ55_9CYAN|nr:response regulator [Atlanticothrix silvestris]MBH8553443.1 response regulator [Atlanticothrix silvestris CENA357]